MKKPEIKKPSGNKPNPAPSVNKKVFEFKEFSKEAAADVLTDQIKLLAQNKNTYKTQSKLAATFLMTLNNFKSACFADEDLSNLWQIYNGAYVEHIMNLAIQSGKINAQTEKYLKEELQAYTGAGFEQHINWIIDESNLVNHEGTPYELEVDNDVDNTKKESIKRLEAIEKGLEEFKDGN